MSSEEKFGPRFAKTTMEAAVTGIIVAGMDNRIIYANRKAHIIWGYEYGTMAGLALTELMPLRYRPQHIAGFDRFVATNVPVLVGTSVHVEGLRKDGTEVPIELHLSAGETDDGERVVLAHVIDRTKWQEMENIILQMATVLGRVRKTIDGKVTKGETGETGAQGPPGTPADTTRLDKLEADAAGVAAEITRQIKVELESERRMTDLEHPERAKDKPK